MTKRKSMRTLLIGVLLVSTLALPSTTHAVSSQVFDAGGGTEIERQTGLGNTNPQTAAGTIINLVLGFLGVITMGLFIYAGVLWMTAGGNEDSITKAKMIIRAAVIGLLLVLLSAALANLILQEAGNASGVTVNTGTGSGSIWDTIE